MSAKDEAEAERARVLMVARKASEILERAREELVELAGEARETGLDAPIASARLTLSNFAIGIVRDAGEIVNKR